MECLHARSVHTWGQSPTKNDHYTQQFIADSVNLTIVAYYFKREYSPIIWLAPFSAVIFQVCTHFSVYQVYTKNPSSPPLFWVSFGSFVFLIAMVCFIWWAFNQHPTSEGNERDIATAGQIFPLRGESGH